MRGALSSLRVTRRAINYKKMYVESRRGIRKIINRAYVVMVAVDDCQHPIPVPGLLVETEAEKAEWEGGEKRYALRKQRRIEGY